MTQIDTWLKLATRQLSKESAAQVRREIGEHYEAAREAALGGGASMDEADGLAVKALGDAKAANCQYRKVLLTSAEARIIREGQWECRAVRARKWLLGVPALAALGGSAALFRVGDPSLAVAMLAGGLAMGMYLATPFLPVYTPRGGQIFRAVKWLLLAVTLTLALRPAWLLFSCGWPVAWIEWTRISIRRKLPIAEWPKQLYL
jgi:hypothetical protein